MSSGPNHRRSEDRRQDHGPTWESHTPAKGCNSTHVARSRRKWQDRRRRRNRRREREDIYMERDMRPHFKGYWL